MITGHASHQVGLDADIWLTPMPDRVLTRIEREQISATSMLDKTSLAVNEEVFTDTQVAVIKRAASYREVQRIFVHPAIVILRRSLGGIHFLVGFFLGLGFGFNDAAIVFSQRSTSLPQPESPVTDFCDRQPPLGQCILIWK